MVFLQTPNTYHTLHANAHKMHNEYIFLIGNKQTVKQKVQSK